MNDIPHEFLLDYLFPLDVFTKKMFGNYSIYAGSKMVLATRDNPNKPDDGIWIGTSFDTMIVLKNNFLL